MYALLLLPMLGTDVAATPDHDATARAALALAVAARERQSTPRAIPAPPPAAANAALRSDSQGTMFRTAGAPVWCVGRS